VAAVPPQFYAICTAVAICSAEVISDSIAALVCAACRGSRFAKARIPLPELRTLQKRLPRSQHPLGALPV
jgi:hypothetical protein